MPGKHDEPVFDALAMGYEAWFDKSPGREIFPLELDCIRAVGADFRGEWLEVGVGTGRFAEVLGINHGIDPSTEMLAFAQQRGVLAVEGVGEDLPYRDETMDGVAMFTVLPFLSDPARCFREIERVLLPGGSLVVSLVPADSPWGLFYIEQGKQGHEVFSFSRFFRCDEVAQLAAAVGLSHSRDASCLLCPAGAKPDPAEQVAASIVPGASFVTMLFRKGLDILRQC